MDRMIYELQDQRLNHILDEVILVADKRALKSNAHKIN